MIPVDDLADVTLAIEDTDEDEEKMSTMIWILFIVESGCTVACVSLDLGPGSDKHFRCSMRKLYTEIVLCPLSCRILSSVPLDHNNHSFLFDMLAKRKEKY